MHDDLADQIRALAPLDLPAATPFYVLFANDRGCGQLLPADAAGITGPYCDLAARPALADANRPRLVGIRPTDPGQRLRSGGHLVMEPGEGRSLGWVSSVTQSIELSQWIGLEMLENGAALHGQKLYAVSPLHEESVEVIVTSPHHVDPENARVRA